MEAETLLGCEKYETIAVDIFFGSENTPERLYFSSKLMKMAS